MIKNIFIKFVISIEITVFTLLAKFFEPQDLFILIKPALTDFADIMLKEILILQWEVTKILKSTIKN